MLLVLEEPVGLEALLPFPQFALLLLGLLVRVGVVEGAAVHAGVVDARAVRGAVQEAAFATENLLCEKKKCLIGYG